MTDLNLVVFSGRVVKTPELKKNGDLSILEFSVAINRSVKVKDKEEWKSQVSFVSMTVFGKVAENLVKRLEKGKIVQIQGRLNQNVWEKDGKKLSKLCVVPEKVIVLPGANNTNNDKKDNNDEKKSTDVSVENGWQPVENNDIVSDYDDMEIF